MFIQRYWCICFVVRRLIDSKDYILYDRFVVENTLYNVYIYIETVFNIDD